jgi:hypothetical protein
MKIAYNTITLIPGHFGVIVQLNSKLKHGEALHCAVYYALLHCTI